jgi:hypothetical protein
MIDPRRASFAPYLRTLADLMGLRDWRAEIHAEEPPESPESRASVECLYGRKYCIVRLGDAFLDSAPADQRQTLVHELTHCHFDAAYSVAAEPLGEAVAGIYRRLFEYGIDALAVAWAPHLPLPPAPAGPGPKRKG